MTTAKPKMANPHSHLTSGPQIKALAAERDRLKEINAELIDALIHIEGAAKSIGVERAEIAACARLAREKAESRE